MFIHVYNQKAVSSRHSRTNQGVILTVFNHSLEHVLVLDIMMCIGII